MIKDIKPDELVAVYYRTSEVKSMFEEFVRNRPLETKYSDVMDFLDTCPNYSDDLLVNPLGIVK